MVFLVTKPYWSYDQLPSRGYLGLAKSCLIRTKKAPTTIITQEIPKLLGGLCKELGTKTKCLLMISKWSSFSSSEMGTESKWLLISSLHVSWVFKSKKGWHQHLSEVLHTLDLQFVYLFNTLGRELLNFIQSKHLLVPILCQLCARKMLEMSWRRNIRRKLWRNITSVFRELQF